LALAKKGQKYKTVQQMASVVDRHRVDADADPKPTSHFYVDPDPDSTPIFTRVEKSQFFYFYS
jgi:hypothetical protein